MNELEQKIIELSKNNENEKIEALLIENLKEDPDNIDLLFRLANLELWPPFVNEIVCYIALEKIIVICKKHQALATLAINELKLRFSLMATINKLDQPFQDVLSWLFLGKNPKLIYKPINQLLEYGTCNNPEEIKTFLNGKQKQDPYNLETLFLLALIEQFLPDVDATQNIALFEKCFATSKEIEALATIVLAYIKNQYAPMDEEVLVHRLKNLETTNNEINSMIYYARAWFYEITDPKVAEQYLEKSIGLCQNHVLNYADLARLYLKTNRKNEAQQLIQKAQQNAKNIDSKSIPTYDLNEFLNECIKGTLMGKGLLETITKSNT